MDKLWGEGTLWENSSQYFTWLRGALRRVWSKHPVKLELLKTQRRKIPNPRGKGPDIFACDCAVCGKTFPMKECQVDHKIPAGSLTKLEDIAGFVQRLLCVGIDDLQIACKLCNATLAYAEKQGITFEAARAEKLAISLIKEKKEVAWLKERGIVPASSQAARRAQIIQKLQEGV